VLSTLLQPPQADQADLTDLAALDELVESARRALVAPRLDDRQRDAPKLPEPLALVDFDNGLTESAKRRTSR
jgi:hypothetical protein